MAQKLFDKASLVMIPSQYKEGKIYNIKPEDQSSSFEFERGSAATRVNSSGLIEYVGIGAELITDGGFDDASAWSTSGGANVSGGKLILDAQNEVAQQYNLGIVSGKEYKVDFTIEGENTHLIVYLGSNSSSNADSVYTTQSEGTYSIRLDAHTDGDFIKFNCPASGKNFTVDNVSVRLIENDTPRLDYSGTEPALLLEPQRTNLIAYSNAFDSWNIVGSPIITSDYGISPEGLQNSTRFQAISDRVTYNVGAINADETFSVYMKGSGELRIQVGSDNFYTTVTSEWVRYEFKTTQVGAASNVQIRGNGSEVDLELYGAQYEQGSYATSYIPTSGQTETRNFETYENTHLSDFIGTGNCTFLIDFTYDVTTRENTSAAIKFYSGSNLFGIKGLSVIDRTLQIRGYVGFTGNMTLSGSQNNTTHKVAVKVTGATLEVFYNGTKLSSTLTGFSTYTWSEIEINAQNSFVSKTNKMVLFPEPLTDSECISLTTL